VRDYAHQLNIVTLSRRVALAQTVNAQAEAVAFIDSFKLMMIVSFLAIPLVILVQRELSATKAGASPPSSNKDFCACGRLRCQLRKS
jgi:DHA2 family multidrug resistance protein